MNATVNKILRPFLEALPENNRLERIWVLAKVDFKKRYYNSSLGLFWALLNPLIRLGIYYVIFTKIFDSKIENFALYLFSGLIIWFFFAEATNKSFSVLRAKKYLIENIQFDKVDLFIASSFSAFLGFLFNFLALVLMTLLAGISFTKYSLWLLVLIPNTFILILGINLLLATIHIYIKDINQAWDMVTFGGRFASPIFIPQAIFYGDFSILRFLNPTAGIMINIHETFIYGRPPDMEMIIYDIIYAFALFGLGIWVFNKYSHKSLEKI